MDLTQEKKQHIEIVAEDALTQFQVVAKAAQDALRVKSVDHSGSLASVNTLTSGLAVQNLAQISLENRRSYEVLVREPSIARVVVADAEGRQRTYYICRAMPISGFPNLASYRAPVGRLASRPVGETFQMPDKSLVEVLERAQLHPDISDQVWDSHNTVIESGHFGIITVESLRTLLKKAVTEDLLGQMLAQEAQKANIIEGMRRSVISKMALRDQPVLDQYQDEIFRLPLDKRLLILGPPGTGKTTTLIRRLGQKLDRAFLDDDEKSIVDGIGSINGAVHSESWLMFTPTELLKQYLKEAFAREGVPASDQRITTWRDYRRELARNTFGVLRTATGSGPFILKDSAEILKTEALKSSIEWFTDFEQWQRSAYVKEILTAAERLAKNTASEIAGVGQRLLVLIPRASGSSLTDMFISIAGEVAGIQTIVAGMKEVTDNKIRGMLNLQMNRNIEFVDELAKFIDGLQLAPEPEGDEPDEQDADEEEAGFLRTGRTAAVSAYMRAVRAQARAHVGKRTLGKDSRNAKIIEWLGDRTLNDQDRAEVGESLLVQTAARRFVNPVKRYMDGIPRRYRAFRKLREEEHKWYVENGFSPTDLHPLELDAVLLAILKSAKELLSRSGIMRDIETSVWSPLRPVLELLKNQILVDEATDFSPVQIACMSALTHPRTRSFFACGDFNQRLTTWGSRTMDEMTWVLPDLELKEITVTYRQSRQLNELARSIIVAMGGEDPRVSLPTYVDNEGVAPALLEGARERSAVVDWLARRIREIERFVGQLPSIAIFVENEEEVQPMADSLNAALSAENTQVVACPNGQVMGKDNDVRVFDVQHIKGLEFEAVFFISVDRLAGLQPQLFDKYLYVGATRAATYLGITCEEALPAAISPLCEKFVSDWKTPVQIPEERG